VNLGGRRNKGRAKRAIKGETHSISADYQVVLLDSLSSLYLCLVPMKTSCFNSPSVPSFNSLKLKEQELTVVELW
jgi:hypothetical protein